MTLCGILAIHAFGEITPSTAGLNGDGVTDNTEALQKALGKGRVEVVLTAGIYLLGTVDIPSYTTLRAEPGALIRVNPAKIRLYNEGKNSRDNLRCLLALRGNHITLQNLEFDFTLTEVDNVSRTQRPQTLIFGQQCAAIKLTGLTAERPEPLPPVPIDQRKNSGVTEGRYPKFPDDKESFHLASFFRSQDITMSDCRGKFMQCLLDLEECSRIWSLNNRAEDCYSITRSKLGDEFLFHIGNWSRNVSHQCRWWGGNANDTRKLNPGDIGFNTATIVKRGSRSTDPDFNPYTAGAYDIIVANNYAEYGTTLAWGAKGRHILFQGNTARFMTDYGLGSEGGEVVIFDSNTTINCHTAGLVTMYWSEKVVMNGNLIVVRDEPIEMQYSTYSDPSGYQGGLVRLAAAGPTTKSGAGQAIFSGNLLTSEMSDRPRRIGIEACRDILFSGNKIHNGFLVTKNGAGEVSLLGNEFIMTVPHDDAWLSIAPHTSKLSVRDNIFRNTRPLNNRSATEMLLCAESLSNKNESNLRDIENNQMEGFPLAIWARSFSKNESDRFLIRNNSLDGVIRIEGLSANINCLIEANIDLRKMIAIKPEILNRSTQALPSPAPTPQDRAETDSDAVTTGNTPANSSGKSEQAAH